MLLQWQDELEDRFGLVFQILDKDYIARVRQERGYGVNPWTTHSRFLVSHRLLIDEAYTATLRDWLGDFRPGSLLILDEAHHAAPSSGAKYAIDSKITRAVRDLAGRFEHRLFLSATPHNGHSNSFSALLEILDPQRFCRGVPVRAKKVLDDVMVRRLKEDLRAVAGGFPKRVVRQIDLDGLPADTPELRLSALLDQYRELREERLKGETKRKQATAALLISGLQQRLLSSVEAFARTLRVHRRTVQRQWDAAEAGRPEPSGPRRRAARSSPRASTTTTTGPRSPRRNSRPRKTPRSRRPRCDTTPAGTGRLRPREAAPRRDDRDRRGGPRPARRPGPQAGRLDPAEHVPGPAAARDDADPGPAGPVERHPGPHLHRVRRHQALPPAAALGRHRHDRPGRRADRHLSRPDAAGRARGDQAGLHDRPEEAPASAS